MSDTQVFQMTREERRKKKAISIHCRIVLTPQGEAAKEMVMRWGMVAGKPDGEDSAGRAKLALVPVAEVVSRACECAELLYAEFKTRGWSIDTGDWEDCPDGETGPTAFDA